MTLQQNLAQATARLEAGGVAAARLTAEVLLAHILGRERAYLYAHPEAELEPAAQAQFEAWVAARCTGVPLQHLTGQQEFYGRLFQVSPAALIPRPETEGVVEAVLERIPLEAAARVVDVGTGSGCIAITLALERPRARVVATDISAAALELARENARRLGAAVEWKEADLLRGVDGELDLIVSNPPYLAEAELAALAPEVRDHEPRQALVAGVGGDEVYRRLIAEARQRLRPGGTLVLELGFASAAAVRRALAGWRGVETRRDLQGWERVVVATTPRVYG